MLKCSNWYEEAYLAILIQLNISYSWYKCSMTGVGAMEYSYNSKLRKASICLFYWVYYPGKVLIELFVGLEANFGQHPVKKRRSQKILSFSLGKKSAPES